MSIFWIVVGPLTLWRIIAWLRRRQQSGWWQTMGDALSRCRRGLHHQLGGRKRRRIAREQVRDLAGALAATVHDPVVHLLLSAARFEYRDDVQGLHGSHPAGVKAGRRVQP